MKTTRSLKQCKGVPIKLRVGLKVRVSQKNDLMIKYQILFILINFIDEKKGFKHLSHIIYSKF